MTRDHGYARYRLDGCRCYTCGFARSEYDDRRTRLIAYGRWEPFVDPAEARDHIEKLRGLGYGARRIAVLAGVQRKAVLDIAAGYRHDSTRGNPPLTKIRKETAAAILAVPLDAGHVAPGAYVDAAETWRLIADLLEHGLSKAEIAYRLGFKSRALQLGTERVTGRNARAVKELHERTFGTRLQLEVARQRRSRLVRSAEEILAGIEGEAS